MDVTVDGVFLQSVEYQSRWDRPEYLLADASAAAGLRSYLLKSWLDRGVIQFGPYDQKAQGKGSSRVFSLRRIYAIALTVELTRLGLTPSRAGLIALMITDIRITLPDVTTNTTKVPNEGVLLIYPEQDHCGDVSALPEQFSVIPPDMDPDLSEIFEATQVRRTSFAAINLSSVFAKVAKVLAQRGKPVQGDPNDSEFAKGAGT